MPVFKSFGTFSDCPCPMEEAKTFILPFLHTGEKILHLWSLEIKPSSKLQTTNQRTKERGKRETEREKRREIKREIKREREKREKNGRKKKTQF